MVFMDEFLFFDPRALPVILPTLANGAALVLTSSIAPNVADDLMRMLNVSYADGTRVVNVLNWIVSCRTCKKFNKADRCTHVVRRPQHFQKFSDQERQAALMSVFAGAHEREILNVPDAPTRSPAFNQDAIERLRRQREAIYTRDDYVPRVFYTIDPNGGSFSSDMVISSCAYVRINGVIYMVLLGFETCNLCDNLKVGELLVSHIAATRRLKGFELSMAVVIVESNLPGVATDVARHLAGSHIQNVISMREDREPYHATEIRAGSRTNEQNRVAMIEMLKKRLEEKQVLIHKDFVVSRPEYSMYPDVESAMFQQLSSFTLITVVNPRDVTARPKKVYTGKISGGKDDAVLSLADNCYHHAVFMTEERYAMYRTASG